LSQQQQQQPPPTYREALLQNHQNYQISRRPAGAAAAGAGVSERIQHRQVGTITSGIWQAIDTPLATVYVTVPETAEQIKLQRKLLRLLQKFLSFQVHISEQKQQQQQQ
jgi:hypothetical protein